MKTTKSIIVLIFLLYVSSMTTPALADDDNDNNDEYDDDDDRKITRRNHDWWHKRSDITAIDPTERGGTVVSPLEISIESVGFKYTDYDSFILVPDDGTPSMVLIFKKGSIESTLYIDNDAKELLDNKKNDIKIIGVNSLKVKKTDITKIPDTELYQIEVTDNNDKKNLKNTIDNELLTGSKVIYPQISGPSTDAKGSAVIIKKSENIGLFDIKSINDFMLWVNLKFSMDLKNEEKQILQDGIFATLEKVVEDNTAAIPGESTESQQVISENTCTVI